MLCVNYTFEFPKISAPFLGSFSYKSFQKESDPCGASDANDRQENGNEDDDDNDNYDDDIAGE